MTAKDCTEEFQITTETVPAIVNGVRLGDSGLAITEAWGCGAGAHYTVTHIKSGTFICCGDGASFDDALLAGTALANIGSWDMSINEINENPVLSRVGLVVLALRPGKVKSATIALAALVEAVRAEAK